MLPSEASAAKAEEVENSDCQSVPAGGLLDNPPELDDPHALRLLSEAIAANELCVDWIAFQPVPCGPNDAPVPPAHCCPHVLMLPSEPSAANATMFDRISVKPVPNGAPVPPFDGFPHAWMLPSAPIAANAVLVAKIFVQPVPVGDVVGSPP